MSKKRHLVINEEGLPCPRCGTNSETRVHTEITEKTLKQPFYYSKWFNCNNPDCVTTTFMSEEFKVWNKNGAAQQFKDVEEDQATLDFISSIR